MASVPPSRTGRVRREKLRLARAVLFDSDAMLSTPDGAVFKGVYAIRAYYVQDINSYSNFTIVKIPPTVEVRGNEAYATYNIQVGPWYRGLTENVKFFYKDTFVMKRVGDTWKITALTRTKTGRTLIIKLRSHPRKESHTNSSH
jgi:hypothetical protein